MEKITREIEFQLTEEEYATKAHEIAELHGETQEIEEELKSVKKSLGDKIKHNRDELSKLCRVIEAGKEIRNCECEMKKDFDSNTVEFFLNGKLVDSRAMESHERQKEMFAPPEGKAEDPLSDDVANDVFDEALGSR